MTAPENTPPVGLLATLVDAWRGLWRHAIGHRRRLGCAAALLLSAELMRLPLPWLAGQAVNQLQSLGLAGAPVAARWLAALLGLVLLAWLCHASGRILERQVAQFARQDLALGLMQRLLRAPLAWHRREHPLVVSQRAMQGSQALNDFAESQYIYLQSAVRLVGPVVALSLLDVWLGAAAAVGLLLLGAISLCFDRVMLRLSDVKNEAERRNTATWGELLVQLRTLRALRLEAGALAVVRQRLAAVLRPLARLVLINEGKWGAVDVLGQLFWGSLVVLYVVRADATVGGAIALGSVFMVYEYARQAEGSLSSLAADFAMLAGQLSGWRALQPLQQAPVEEELPRLQASGWTRLSTRALCLGYEDGRQVLGGLDLWLVRGRSYALSGASGAGKSTLLAVLAGLEPARSGQIRLDAEVVQAQRLRREATLVPAQAAVFSGSVRENLAPGQPELPEQRLWQALASVALDDFVRQLPRGLDTDVGDGQSTWSAGQQQRLALARASVAATDTGLLLLDEPTAHLDRDNAQSVLRGLLAAHRGACVVAALHDPALLHLFDHCMHIDNGVLTTAPLAA
nr:ABC transporter ATP-binding protein [uncultured Rhodoferax sp.]